MSLIFGIFNRSGRPVSPRDIDTMYRAVAHFPHEQYQFKIQDNIAFGHMLTYSTPESVYEQLPKYLPGEKLFFAAGGRLNNRKEIAELLNLKLKDNLADGELIFQAYRQWGKETPEKLLGQWSFAAFRAETGELFLARDHHGYTALAYYLADDLIVFSSSIKAILALPEVPKKLNERTVLRSLALLPGDYDQTFYKNIFHLLPAHTLLVSRNSCQKNRFWFPEKIAPVFKKNINDYAIEFKEILDQAVKSCLRSYKPVSAMLSGGLDSGTVSFLAAEFLKKQEKPLTTYSHVPLYEAVAAPGRNGDETPYIKATAEASGNINPVFIDSGNTSTLYAMFKMLEIMESPIYAAVNCNWLIDITAAGARDGFGALLTGETGNAAVSFSGTDYLLPWQRFYRTQGLKRTIKYRLLKPFILKNFPEIYKKIKPGNDWQSNSYISPAFAEKVSLPAILKKEASIFKTCYQDARENMLAIIMPGFNHRCYSGAALSNYFGIEWRDPSADKRVIEYALTIPNEAFFNENNENRNIIKIMMKNKLPDKVLYAREKGLQGADTGKRLSSEKKRFDELLHKLGESALVGEFIDIKRLENDWRQIKNINDNRYDITKINHLLRVIMIGCLLTRFEAPGKI
jgi:asparagine synthase (glutamine-hydrolysing)